MRRPLARLSRGRTSLVRGEAAPDTAPPSIASATIPADGLSVVLEYGETLDGTSVPAALDYGLAGTASTVDSVAIVGTTVVLTLDVAVFQSETVTLDYTAGAAPVRDVATNEADNLNDYAVTNNSEVSGDTQAPLVLSVTVPANGLTTVLVYDEDLDETSVPDPADYAYAGTARTVTAVDVTGDTVTLTNSGAIAEGATVTLDYTAGVDPVRDLALNEADDLIAEAVTNNSTSDQTDPELDGDPEVSTDGTYVSVFFNEDMDQTSTPDVADVDLDGTLATADDPFWEDARELRIPVIGAIMASETVTLDYVEGANPIQDLAANPLGNLTAQAVTNNSTQRPDLVAITRFTDTTGNYPADVLGPAIKWCWAGGGGGTTNTSSGGAGGFSEDAAYVYAANEAWSIIVGTGGAVGGGTGGDTSIGASCVAKGAVGTTGGSTTGAAGTATLAGLSGTVAAGAQSGAPSHGSSTAASGSTPGEPNGGAVQGGASAAKIPGSGGRSGTSVQVAGAAGLAVLMYEQLAAANFPGLEGLSLTRSTGTSHSVTVPAGDSADQVLYIVASDGAPTIDVGSGAATSVTSVAHGTDGKLEVFRYTGASPPTSVTTSVSETINVVVLRLNAAGTPEGSATSSSGANAAAATHAPSGGNGDYRVVTVLSRADFATTGNITGRPAGFDYSVFLPAQALGPAASSAPDLCVAWDDAAVVGNAGGGNWTNTSASCCVATITIAKV